MAKSTLVSPSFRACLRCTKNIFPASQSADLSNRRSSSAGEASPPISRMETVRGSFCRRGFPPQVVELILANNRSATNTAYESAWRNWNHWCLGRNLNPLSNDLASVLSFLTSLHESGKSYNTVNIHRSMLSMTLDRVDGSAVGQHPLVVRLLKRCYNQNPPHPRYSFMWDVEIVLSFMRSEEDNFSLNLASLTKKLATLLAISTLLRTSELASLEKDSLVFLISGVNLSLSRPRKSQTNGFFTLRLSSQL